MFLETDPFLNELSKLFKRHEKSGTVWVTLKRSNQRPTPRQRPPSKKQASKKKKLPPAKASSTAEYCCLVRATDGKRKISTTVSTVDYAKFQASYSLILKAHMDALKKRQKKPEPKQQKDKK